jgi:predicted small integral membrane protein
MEYISDDLPVNLRPYVSLGGALATIIISVIVLLLYAFSRKIISSTLLAGVLALPGMYSLRFVILGRGHDATEFQEAQAALGFSYSGNSLDWIFLVIFLSGTLAWIYKSKPGYKKAGRLLVGTILTIAFIVVLQEVNNAVFNPLLAYGTEF